MNATHIHKETASPISARELEEPVTVHLHDGAHDFIGGDYEVVNLETNLTKMVTAEEFEEEYEAI